MPLLKVGLRVVSQNIFAVYEMTQPLKFLNSVGLLGSLTSSVYHYSAIKNQVCSTSDFSLQMTVFYGGPQVHSEFQMTLLIFKHTPDSKSSLLILKAHS